jgi:hypothetical protein
MTYEDPEDKVIFSLLRLRLPGKSHSEKPLSCREDSPTRGSILSPCQEKEATILSVLPELEGAALIREIHTFGDQLSI